jgi:hypothetical protein
VILGCFTIVLSTYGIVLTVLFGVIVLAGARSAERAPRFHIPRAP